MPGSSGSRLKCSVFDTGVFQEIYGVLHRYDLLCVFIGNLEGLAFLAEFLFQRHDQFNEVETICVQIVDKGCRWDNLLLFHA